MPHQNSIVLLPYLLLALAAGVATAFQPGVNARFASVAGHPIHGGLINFCVGACAMVVVWLIASRFLHAPLPQPSQLATGPGWMGVGGLLGAFFVTTAVVVAPRAGTANYLSAMVAGQLIASLVIDHFALMGLPQISISPARVLGVLLILGGMAAVRLG